MSFDADAHRRESLEAWEAAASGWTSRRDLLQAIGAPVSHWMIEAIAPQPGQRVLELAAGTGETGMLVAELVAPMGSVIVSDQAEAMLEGARRRAEELGLENVEFRVLNAEWIDLPLASVDAVVCRWGYMLMADPATALAETRRVLRPGGRLALAVWDALEHNPWASLPAAELRERGIAPGGGSAQPGLLQGAGEARAETPVPGPFALGDEARLIELLGDAGFQDVEVQRLEVERRQESFEALWETTLDLSRSFHDAVLSQTPAEIEQIHDALQDRFGVFTQADGSLRVPGRTLVACAVG